MQIAFQDKLSYFGRLVLIVLSMSPAAGWTQALSAYEEDRIKAAFLLRFAEYVQWPPDVMKQASSIVVGVLGDDDVTTELKRILPGRKVHDRPIAVKPLDSIDDLAGIHVLFIGQDEKDRLAIHLKALRQRPILVVTDLETGLNLGSVINFLIVDRRVRFEISLEAAERHGLTLSSRLLAVAMRVRKGELAPDATLAESREHPISKG